MIKLSDYLNKYVRIEDRWTFIQCLLSQEPTLTGCDYVAWSKLNKVKEKIKSA